MKFWNWLYAHNSGFYLWTEKQKADASKHAVKQAAAKFYGRKPEPKAGIDASNPV